VALRSARTRKGQLNPPELPSNYLETQPTGPSATISPKYPERWLCVRELGSSLRVLRSLPCPLEAGLFPFLGARVARQKAPAAQD